ncbi:MAG: hypothetical protein WKF76_08275 [Nocardioidaceae bacterium]
MPVLFYTAALPSLLGEPRLGRGPEPRLHLRLLPGVPSCSTPLLPTEVRETSGLVPVAGGLGAGKSVLMGLITYEAVRRGIPA